MQLDTKLDEYLEDYPKGARNSLNTFSGAFVFGREKIYRKEKCLKGSFFLVWEFQKEKKIVNRIGSYFFLPLWKEMGKRKRKRRNFS